MVVRSAPPTLGIIRFPGFAKGCGYFYHEEGGYAIAEDIDTGFGFMMPGLREVVDRTGIPAGYRVRKAIRHNDVMMLIATNGTDSRVLRLEAGVWAVKESVVASVCTDIVSFNNVVAVGYGSSVAYRFSSDNGTTWTASTKTGNGRYFNYATARINGQVAPRVDYCVNPNLLFYTTDLTNTATAGTASSTVGDNQASADYFTSVTEDDTGVLLIGKRRALFSINSEGMVIKLTREFNDPPADAGGQSDRNNFESYTDINGIFFYIVEGYKLLLYDHGDVNEFMAPQDISTRHGPVIPRLTLPLNAITKAGPWIILALGDKNTGTDKSVTNAPGGTALLQNSFTTTSEIYRGLLTTDERGERTINWHGVILTCSQALRYMWYDEDDSYVYMASGDSETVNNQQVRAYVLTKAPLTHLVGGIINLGTGAGTLEGGLFGDGEINRLLRIKAQTVGLADATPSLRVGYRPQSDFNAAAYTNLNLWIDNFNPEMGAKFPPHQYFRTCRLRFVGTPSGTNTYPILKSASLEIERGRKW